jgi:hypothetical protein
MKIRSSFRVPLFAVLAAGALFACGLASPTPTVIAPLVEPASTPGPTLQDQCPDGNCTDACIAKLNSVLEVSDQPLSPPKGALSHDLKDNPIILVVYDVNGDRIGSPSFVSNVPADLVAYQQETSAQEAVWKYFASIIPRDRRTELTSFVISTDGKGGLLASVVQFSSHPQNWALNVDIVDTSKPRNLTFTLIHEIGHLLTLNDSQISLDATFLAHPDDQQIYTQAAASCPQYFASDGCSQPDSYINRFFNKFWPKLFDEWSRVNAKKDESNYSSLLARFYRSHPTQFISPYAATSPEEDIAESWAYFVLTPKPADDSIAHQKVLFFYDFPELVQLREQIVNGICNYALDQ